jgi:hypothetical protein
MKALTILFISLFFLFIGCQDNNSILEPTNDLSDISLEKGRPILVRDLGDDGIKLLDGFEDLDNYNINYSQNFTIDGNKGGRVSVTHSWKDGRGMPVSLKSELVIPRNAFKGELTFDMIFDLENYSMELYPSPFTFDKPVEFSMYFYGIDLSEFRGYDIDFNYLDGETEDIEYYSKDVNFDYGNLVIWGAQLHHFSRYGWTRTK